MARRRFRPGIEALEDRCLLAQYAFEVNLYADVNGSPGELLSDAVVEVGQPFFAEITATDLRDQPLGLRGLGLGIYWDPNVFEETDSPSNLTALDSGVLTPRFPLFRGGSLDNEAGKIDELQGTAFLADGTGAVIGDEGPERFALLHFRAESPATDSPLVIRVRGGVGFVPMRHYTNADLRFESQTITVVERSSESDVDVELAVPPISPVTSQEPHVLAVPRIEVPTGGELIQFTTNIHSAAGASLLVRPAAPDEDKFFEVSNTGDAPLTITEIRINVPDVTAASGGSPFVVQPGEAKRIGVVYAPSTPSATDATVQSFDIADGIVIFSNAENAPVVEVGLRGDSTFDADTNYDGRVDLADLILFDQHFGLQSGDDGYSPQIDPNGDSVIDVGDLRPFAAHFHLSREVPVVGPVQSSAQTAAEGEGQESNVPSSNACIAAPGLHTNVSSMPQEPSRSVPQARVRSTSFVGPVLPHEYATHLIFAEPANQLASLANPNQLDDELVDVLATDVDSQYGPLAL